MFDNAKIFKSPDEMELMDDAMFSVTMRDLELVRLMLSYILDREVVSVKAHTQRRTLGSSALMCTVYDSMFTLKAKMKYMTSRCS